MYVAEVLLPMWVKLNPDPPVNGAQASNCFNWVLRGASASRDAELYDKITFGMPIRILIPSILQVQI